jgi:hypothetical protein
MNPQVHNFEGIKCRQLKLEKQNRRFKQLGVAAASLLILCIVMSRSVQASQDSQTQPAPQTTIKPLTNSDILDMLSAGVSQEVVIAKIAASTCEFDTSPAALKLLKAAKVPDAVALAMVQSPTRSHGGELTIAEPSAPALIDCKSVGPVYAYPAPPTSGVLQGIDSPGVFMLSCGEKIELLNPGDKQSWLRIRGANGQVGYVSFYLVSRPQSAESTQEGQPSPESKKREDAQKANDDLEDCRTWSQNEYDTKMNAVGTLALTPIQRVYASTRLKQNLDAELRRCRSQYESRLKASDGK